MKYCNCPGCKVVMDMQSMIEFNELTGFDDDYKKMFKDLLKEHFREEKTDETDQVVKSKVS